MIATDKSHARRHIVEWLCTGVLIAASGAIAGRNLTGVVTGCALGGLYVAAVWLAHRLMNRRRGPKNENLSPVMGRIMFDAVVKLPTPVFICDEDERILWYNTATETLYSSKNKLYGESVKELFGVGLAEIRSPETGDGVVLSCEGRHFLARYTAIKTDDNDFCLIMTDEITSEEHLRQRLTDEELAVAYIYVDNFAEMMQYDSENYRIAAAKIDEMLVNRSDRNLTGMLELLATEEDFLGVLVDEATAFDLLETGTLVVVGDVSNVAIMESPELARRAGTLAIIDHHRKVAEFDRPVAIEYIEPSASSASELVAEMLEQVLPKDELPSQEATLLLAGIILDTGKFTRSTGTRTFSAAMFLRDCGALPEAVVEMNRTSMDDYQREGKFRQNITLYRGQCAIACAQTDNQTEAGPADRIIAAKAANNLLSVEGIEASFALMKLGDVIHISARSNGSINVQLILEQMGGGGHYDAAGAQLSGLTMREAVDRLKAAIDTQM